MDVKNDFKALFGEIDDLYFTNEGFKILMETKTHRAPKEFFNWLQIIYETDVIMRISRILEQNPNGPTLSEVLKKIKCDCSFIHLCKDIENDLNRIEEILKPFKVHRDKRLAHFDRNAKKILNKTDVMKHSKFDDAIKFIMEMFDKYNRLINGKGEVLSTAYWDEMFKNISINYNK